MTILKIYKLEDSEETEPLSTLYDGEHIIGRGFLNCNDKRVSRKHARIIIGKNCVTIKSEHINPCFYKSSVSNSISILPKDKSVTLNNNDQFALLSDTFWFRVKVINDNHENQSNSTTQVPENEALSVVTSFKRNNGTSNNSSPFKKQRTSYEATSKSPLADVETTNRLLDNLEQCVENEAHGSLTNTSHRSNEKEQVSDDECCNNKEKKAPDISNNIVEENQLNGSEENDIKPDLKTIDKMSHVPKESNALLDKQIKDEPSTSTTIKIENTDENEVKTTNENGKAETVGDNVNKECDTAVDDVDNVTNNVINATDNVNYGTNVNGATDNVNNVTDNASGMKTRRDRCWYGQACYRKNPQHRIDLSHPGDDDYDSDPNDDRPDCPFGGACYRANLDHRREFKHRGRPAPKPNDPGPSSPSTSTPATKPKRQRNKRKQRRNSDKSDESDVDSDVSNGSDDQSTPLKKKRKAAPTNLKVSETPEDDYDHQDPFINDATDDEFQLSDDADVDDDSDWEESQQVDEESQEIRRLLREAKKFTKRKK